MRLRRSTRPPPRRPPAPLLVPKARPGARRTAHAGVERIEPWPSSTAGRRHLCGAGLGSDSDKDTSRSARGWNHRQPCLVTPDSCFVFLGTHQWCPVVRDTFLFGMLCVANRSRTFPVPILQRAVQSSPSLFGSRRTTPVTRMAIPLCGWVCEAYPCPANIDLSPA